MTFYTWPLSHSVWLWTQKTFGCLRYDFFKSSNASHTHNCQMPEWMTRYDFIKSYQWMSDTNKRYDIHKVISAQVRIKYTVWLLIRKSYRLIKPCNTHQYVILKPILRMSAQLTRYDIIWECHTESNMH